MDAERTAADEYRQYWLDKFNQVGVVFKPDGLYGRLKAIAYGYDVEAWAAPAQFRGFKLEVTTKTNGIQVWHTIKINSDTGFHRFMRRLTTGGFK